MLSETELQMNLTMLQIEKEGITESLPQMSISLLENGVIHHDSKRNEYRKLLLAVEENTLSEEIIYELLSLHLHMKTLLQHELQKRN